MACGLWLRACAAVASLRRCLCCRRRFPALPRAPRRSSRPPPPRSARRRDPHAAIRPPPFPRANIPRIIPSAQGASAGARTARATDDAGRACRRPGRASGRRLGFIRSTVRASAGRPCRSRRVDRPEIGPCVGAFPLTRARAYYILCLRAPGATCCHHRQAQRATVRRLADRGRGRRGRDHRPRRKNFATPPRPILRDTPLIPPVPAHAGSGKGVCERGAGAENLRREIRERGFSGGCARFGVVCRHLQKPVARGMW